MHDADTELLERAAKADGRPVTDAMRELWKWPKSSAWNPLDDSADALELAAKLRIDVQSFHDDGVRAVVDRLGLALAVPCPLDGDRCAATRRALVRAAAALAVDENGQLNGPS